MSLEESKELYKEELILLKLIKEYNKSNPANKLGRKEQAILLLLHRISENMFSTLLLTDYALKKGKWTMFQLPLGLILRCTFTDSLLAIYLQSVDKERCIEELDLRTIEYANSMLERKEVYRDQVKSTGSNFDDSFIDLIWELTMEDNFLGPLTVDVNKKELEVIKKSKAQLQQEGFTKLRSIGIKDQLEYLQRNEALSAIATRLYHYYKYFSQYEHFSENGQGDVLATSEGDNDNIHFPSAIRALRAGVEKVIELSRMA